MPSRMIAPMPAARLTLAACLAFAAPMTGGGTAFAADGAEAESAVEQPPEPPPRNEPDFLFGQPRGVVGLSTGWLRASAGGVLDWVHDHLIRGIDEANEKIPIGDRAFDAAPFRFVGGFAIGPRVDLMLDVSPASRTVASECSDWTDSGRPLAQSTQVWQIPLNASVRYWVLPRGRSIGRLAWVPSTLAFHVGAGGGTRWYRLEQYGEFVDEARQMFYTDRLRSQGWALSRHVSAGASVRLTPRLFAVAEVRQVWSRTVASQAFTFGDVDLNGLHLTGGIEFVF